LQKQKVMYKIGGRVKVYGQIVEIDDLSFDHETKEIKLIYLDECIVVKGSEYTRDWCHPEEVQEHYPKK